MYSLGDLKFGSLGSGVIIVVYSRDVYFVDFFFEEFDL